MSGFICVSRTRFFASAGNYFIQRSDCEFVRKPSFRAVPRTSRGKQYHFPLACPHLFFIYFQVMPSKNRANL